MGFEESSFSPRGQQLEDNVGLEYSSRAHAFWVGEPGFAPQYGQALEDRSGELWLQPSGYASQRGG